MKYLIKYIVFASLFFNVSAYAQAPNCYHLDVYNGLPSNHVYRTLVDHFGYLWIATDKGVVRYNGYGFKLYDASNGLPNDDVWNLFEDKKGRIWLMSIANGIGYIQNNDFKKAFINGDKSLIYPRCMEQKKDGIVFLTLYHNDYSKQETYNTLSTNTLCIENKDTIRQLDLYKWIGNSRVYLNTKGDVISILDDKVTKIKYNDDGRILKQYLGSFRDTDLQRKLVDGDNYYFYHKIIAYKYNDNYIRVLDLDSFKQRIIQIKNIINENKRILRLIVYKSNIYLYTKYFVYKIDSNFHLSNSFSTQSLADSAATGTDISFLRDYKKWGICLSTTSKGLFINQESNDYYKKITSYNLDGFKYIGNISDTVGYWWNNASKLLLKLTNTDKKQYYHEDTFPNVDKIIKYNSTFSILLTDGQLAWINNKTEKKIPFFKDVDHYKESYVHGTPKYYKVAYVGIIDGISYNMDSLYFIATMPGFFSFRFKGRSLIANGLDINRYKHLTYDSMSRTIWVYNNYEILLYKTSGQRFKITNEVLNQLHINHLEKLLIDKYHDIIIKDYNNVYVFNYASKKYMQLFKTYNLKGATIFLQNNWLVVVGDFGILFSKIYAPNSISKPIVYSNVKNIYYTLLYGVQIFKDKMILNTDKGAYAVRIPLNDKKNSIPNFSQQFRFTVLDNDTLFGLYDNDSLLVNPKNLHLQFDVINPMGSGKVRYQCYLKEYDKGWHELPGNEYTLPALDADRYYTLFLQAYDDASKSHIVKLHLYIKPYWWQSRSGKRMIWIGAILLLGLFATLIIVVTKKIVTKGNERRNKTLEIELKSIYSQINPHFIFNSLSAALYFIRKKQMDEAYMHIAKFSKLLRSYIKSSRNRFVVLSEEIINLRNYIELQQTRFENKFDYQIEVEEGLPIESTKMPSLLLQPIVENAINHGIFHKETKGHLLITFKKDKKKSGIICVIDDDGIGRKQSKKVNKDDLVKAESYGEHLIRDLVRIFNEYEKINIDIEYIDKEEPETGTTVIVTIKNAIDE